MNQKAIKTILLVSAISIFSSCSKEKVFETEILSVDNIEWNQAEVNVKYTLTGNKNKEVEMGLCLSNQPKPGENDIVLTVQNSISSSSSFTLENLTALSDYHIRAYIKDLDGFFNYSNEITFTTPDIPLPCTVAPNTLYVNGFSYDLNAMYQVTDDEEAIYECNSPFGIFEFRFSQIPVTNLYNTSNEISTLVDDESIVITGHLNAGPWYCYHYTNNNQKVKVVNQDGNIYISFCDFEFSSNSSCWDNSYLISGYFSTE